MKITYLLAVMLTALLVLTGCPSLEGSCEDCCKAKLKQMQKEGILSSQEAYSERETCTNLCVENAKAQHKEPDWVERNQACD